MAIGNKMVVIVRDIVVAMLPSCVIGLTDAWEVRWRLILDEVHDCME